MRMAKDIVLDMMIILGQKANRFKAQVVHSERASSQSAFYHTGLRFHDLTEADRKVLRDYFDALEKGHSPGLNSVRGRAP